MEGIKTDKKVNEKDGQAISEVGVDVNGKLEKSRQTGRQKTVRQDLVQTFIQIFILHCALLLLKNRKKEENNNKIDWYVLENANGPKV